MSQGFGIESAEGLKSDRHQRKPTEVPDIGAIQQSLVQHFGDIKDPRAERTKKHLLTDNKRDRNSRNHCRGARMGRH